MDYIELINEFWKQNGFKPFGATDTMVYFYLLHQCHVRGWLNPFQVQTRDIEYHLSITRKQIGESKNRLRDRGMIDFTAGSRKDTPTYTILGLSSNMFLTETQSETQTETYIETYSETQTETYQEIPPKERSPIPPKEYTPKETDNNNILLTRTREEAELWRFDKLLQEVVDGKHRMWEDEMRKKHRIDNVVDYLPSFRSHVIANAKMTAVTDVNGFKRYFNVAFRFFSKSSPLELLGQYEATAKTGRYRSFCGWYASNTPNVASELLPLTEEEFTRLMDVYGSEKIGAAVMAISNRRDLVAKYYSLYQTLVQWLDRDFIQS